jgi:5-methylcytosine-specific restriction endonuclease McrA
MLSLNELYYKRAELESEFYSSKVKTRSERKSFSRYVKDEILERQQNRCAMCNDKLFYPHFDHIDGNRSNNSLSNCQALCPNCHELKTRRDQKGKNDRF